MFDKPSLGSGEKEAVMAAMVVPSWASLSKSRIKALKTKRDKSLE